MNGLHHSPRAWRFAALAVQLALLFLLALAASLPAGRSSTAAGQATDAGATAAPPPRVPIGFTIERVAADPFVRYPMFATLDDRGRLYVAESSGLDLYAELASQTRRCRIRLLDDADGDGRYESSRVFADKLVFPMGLAWRDGKLYVADPPDLVVLEDADGDGAAERRTVILTGFGHKDNGSLHGLDFGPDGWLYMTMGSPDGYRLRAADGSLLVGESGALIRCRPDGSQPEVLARGFVNLVEVVHLPTGEIIGTDNWFQLPAAGIRDALVHIVEGGLYPYHPDAGTPQPITGVVLPAVELLPAVAVSGLECYRGVAFPTEFRGQLFSAQHNARAVARHELSREGATFTSRQADFVTSDDPDFHPSDVLEDADGSLLVLDTGAWYVQHCPTGRLRQSQSVGGIYRVRFAGAAGIADAWGRSVAWDRLPSEAIAKQLGDARPRVRERARRELVRRGAAAVGTLSTVLEGETLFVAKEQAIWGLAAIDDESAGAALHKALASDDADVVTLAVRAVAARGDRQSASHLTKLLTHAAARVRRAAAEALARQGDSAHVAALAESLAKEPDRFCQHSLVYALHRLAARKDLEPFLQSPSARVARSALILLDQPPRAAATLEMALGAVASDQEPVRQAGVFVLKRHADWAARLADVVRDLLAKPSPTASDEAAAAELVAAFVPDPAVAAVVAEALAGRMAGLGGARRARLWDVVAGASASLPAEPLTAALETSLADADAAVQLAAVRTIGRLALLKFDDRLSALADDAGEPAELRLTALGALVPRRPAPGPAGLQLLLSSLAADVAPELRLVAAEIVGRSQLDEAALNKILPLVEDDPLLSPSVLVPAIVRSARASTARPVFDYLQSSVRAGWRPDPATWKSLEERLTAIDADRTAELRAQLSQFEADARARLARFEPLLSGGDAGRGREVFRDKKVACATCHRAGGEGGTIGPDLARIAAVRSGRDLVESIVVPSSTFAQGYETYLAVTGDGQSLVGVIARQDARALVLRDSAGRERTLPRESLEELRRSPTSLMPDGLAAALAADELRDLLAYLQGLK